MTGNYALAMFVVGGMVLVAAVLLPFAAATAGGTAPVERQPAGAGLHYE